MTTLRRTIGAYSCIRALGSGGTGTVYLAHHRGLERKVALKVLSDDCVKDPLSQKRFRREAQAAMRVSHPSLVKLLDFGQEGDVYFLAMEYVEGLTLQQILRTDGALDTTRSLQYVRQLLEGLAECHAAGFIHRDIKPGNLLIDHTDRLRILDLGFAKHFDRTLITAEGATIGTPRYVAPELLLGGTGDARSDLYQTGLILHECLTGTPTFAHQEFNELIHLILTSDPPALPPEVSTPQIQQFLARTLDKDPDRRFANCREALDFLARKTRSTPRVPLPGRTSDPTLQPPMAHPGPARTRARVAALVALAGLTSVLWAGALALRLHPAATPREDLASVYTHLPKSPGALSSIPGSPPPPEVMARVGLTSVTLCWSTQAPTIGVLSEPATGRTTRESNPTQFHAITLTGLTPDREHTLQITSQDGRLLRRWVGRLLTVNEAVGEVSSLWDWSAKTLARAMREFRRPLGAPDRTRLGVRFREEIHKDLARPDLRRALALCREIAPFALETPALTPTIRALFLFRTDQIDALRRFIREASGVDPEQLSTEGMAPEVLAREPAGVRPYRAWTFARPTGIPVPADLTQRIKVETLPCSAIFSADVQSFLAVPSEPQQHECVITGPFLPAGRWRVAYVRFRVHGGAQTEKIVLSVRDPKATVDMLHLAFLWPGERGRAREGWLRVDERLLIDSTWTLHVAQSRRSAGVVSEGVVLDYLAFYGES